MKFCLILLIQLVACITTIAASTETTNTCVMNENIDIEVTAPEFEGLADDITGDERVKLFAEIRNLMNLFCGLAVKTVDSPSLLGMFYNAAAQSKNLGEAINKVEGVEETSRKKKPSWFYTTTAKMIDDLYERADELKKNYHSKELIQHKDELKNDIRDFFSCMYKAIYNSKHGMNFDWDKMKFGDESMIESGAKMMGKLKTIGSSTVLNLGKLVSKFMRGKAARRLAEEQGTKKKGWF